MIKGYPVTVIAVTIASITLCITAGSSPTSTPPESPGPGTESPVRKFRAGPRLPYVMGTPVMVTGECRV